MKKLPQPPLSITVLWEWAMATAQPPIVTAISQATSHPGGCGLLLLEVRGGNLAGPACNSAAPTVQKLKL